MFGIFMVKKRGRKKKVKKVEKALTKKLLKEEEKIEALEEKEIEELKKLEQLEKEIEKEIKKSPLKKITYHDIVRSSVGALIGIAGHFSFFYGAKIAEKISMIRAGLLFVISFIICYLLIYVSGFRKVKHLRAFVPIRAIVVYVVAIVMIIFILFIFGFINIGTNFGEAFKMVAVISLMAVLGAAAADLVGGD